jgi:hypothetical protein
MLREQVLAVIAEEPGIHAREVMRKFALFQHDAVLMEIQSLRRSGMIEMCAHGRYRLPSQPETSISKPPFGSGFIAPPSRARLMAGR